MTEKIGIEWQKNWHLGLTKNKSVEVELLRQPWNEFWNYFRFNLKLNRKIDHAGFEFEIDILGFNFSFSVRDNRHWDYDRNCWEDEETTKRLQENLKKLSKAMKLKEKAIKRRK